MQENCGFTTMLWGGKRGQKWYCFNHTGTANLAKPLSIHEVLSGEPGRPLKSIQTPQVQEQNRQEQGQP